MWESVVKHMEIYAWLKEWDETSLFNYLDVTEEVIAQTLNIVNSPQNLKQLLPIELKYYISELIDILRNNFESLRKSQVASLIAIIDHLLEWKTRWLVKLPTWMWKTRLFSEIIEWLQLNTAIFIPNNHLKSQVSEYFDSRHTFIVWDSKKSVAKSVKEILTQIEIDNIEAPIIICTYKALLHLKSDAPDLFKEFSSFIELIVRDEAHKSLWDETSELLDNIVNYNDNYLLSEGYSLDWWVEKIELLFTATPNLLSKSIKECYEIIISLRLQDWVEEWILHMPGFERVPKAYVNLWDKNINQSHVDKNALKFCDEEWNLSYIQLINKYIELKEKNEGYFPGIWFCRSVEHAEFIKQEMEKKWVRTIRVTSASKGLDKWIVSEKAKYMLERNEVDFVLTVSKVAEWWDIPTLRCAVSFAPTFSEAKYVQWIWRILRVFEYFEEYNQYWILPKTGAVIIEPESWEISNSGNWGISKKWRKKDSEDTKNTQQKQQETKSITLKEIHWWTRTISGMMHLIKSEEFDTWFLEEKYWSLIEYIDKYKLEEDWTVEIKWVLYTAVTNTMSTKNSRLTCSWATALKEISNLPQEWLNKNRLLNFGLSWYKTIDLYNLEELLKVLPKWKLLEDWSIEIEWVIYTAINNSMSTKNSRLPCSWKLALKKIKQQSEKWLKQNRLLKKWLSWKHTVDLYNLEEVLKILPNNK